MPKAKHTTHRFVDQMSNIKALMDTDFYQEITQGLQSSDNLGTNFTEKSLPQLIAYFKEGVNKLSNINPDQIRTGANSRFNTGKAAEDLEANLAACVTEIQNRANKFKETTGYNREEGRQYDFISSVVDIYNGVQQTLDNIGEPYNRRDLTIPVEDSLVDYEEAQNNFIQSLTDYTDHVNSNDFNIGEMPEEVNAALNGASLSADSILKNANIPSLTDALKTKILAEQEILSNLEKEKLNREQELQNKFGQDKRAIDAACDALIKKERDGFDQHTNELYDKANKLDDIINAKRPEEATKKNEENIKSLNSDDFKGISEKYILGEEWYSGSKTQDELKTHFSEITNSINSLTDIQKQLRSDLDTKKLNIKDLKELLPLYENMQDPTKDPDYMELQQKSENIKAQIDELSADKDIAEFGDVDALNKDFMQKYNLDFEPVDHSERDAKIKDDLGKIYKEIGNGGFGSLSWPKDGRNLNKAEKDLNRIFIHDFNDLGYDNLDEDSPKPFKMNESLQADFYNISEALIKNEGSQGKFTDKKEALCASTLLNHKDDIREFGESINPDFETDPQRKQSLVQMKKDVLDAANALDAISKRENVMNALSSIDDNLQPSDKDLELRDKVSAALDEKKGLLEEQSYIADAEVIEFPKKAMAPKLKVEAQLKAEEEAAENLENTIKQNDLDLNYLKVGKEIVGEELEKRTLADNKQVAENDLAELKKNADKDQLAHKNKISSIQAKQNAGIKKLFDQTKAQIEKSNKDFSKRINAQSNKLNAITGLNEKVAKLGSRSETLKRCATSFGDKLDIMNSKVNTMKDNLKAEHLKDFNNISAKENQTIDKMLATGSRLFGNSEYYENMMTALNTYKQSQENPEGMTKEQYQAAVQGARDSINTYIQNRNDNGGKRRTDVGQIRLDSAKQLLKMFDMKEASLGNYASELRNITNTPQSEIKVKTEAEKVVLNQLEKQPPCKEELLTNRQLTSLVGNKQVRDMFDGLQKGSENINKTISDKLKNSIDSLSKGNASALKSIIASKVGLNLLGKQGNQVSPEEASRLIENLQNKDCIKECAEDILKGHMKPSELDEYLKSDDFNSELKKQVQKKQDAPEKQNSVDNNSLGMN